MLLEKVTELQGISPVTVAHRVIVHNIFATSISNDSCNVSSSDDRADKYVTSEEVIVPYTMMQILPRQVWAVMGLGYIIMNNNNNILNH